MNGEEEERRGSGTQMELITLYRMRHTVHCECSCYHFIVNYEGGVILPVLT